MRTTFTSYFTRCTGYYYLFFILFSNPKNVFFLIKVDKIINLYKIKVTK